MEQRMYCIKTISKMRHCRTLNQDMMGMDKLEEAIQMLGKH